MAWVESTSASFHARHDSEDAEDATRVLDALERARAGLDRLFPRTVGDLTVVLHGSGLALGLAQPYLLAARALTDPAGRRYQVGWAGAREIHVLTPRALEARASGAPGSLEALLLAPAALYAATVVGANSPDLPPPYTPASFARHLRWAWLAEGAAQHFGGQVPHLRAAIARRLREGRAPDFPPARRDAALLGGTVFDLLAGEEGEHACVRLATLPLPGGGAPAALGKAFGGREPRHTERAWRAHLTRLAGGVA
jgi:hypothetical protein